MKTPKKKQPVKARKMAPAFQREDRYIVIKRKDAKKYLSHAERIVLDAISDAVAGRRASDGKVDLECVVVESDWPEYERTWAAIKKRMTQKPERDFDHEEAHARAGYPENR